MRRTGRGTQNKDWRAVDYTSYEGRIYLLREVDLEGDIVMVGSDALGRSLMEDDGATYKDEEAQEIDEYIYCYVSDEILMEDQEILEEYVQKWFT